LPADAIFELRLLMLLARLGVQQYFSFCGEMTVFVTLERALFMVVVFAANAVQAITGFAGTILAMPVSILLLDAGQAKAVLNVLVILCCGWIAIRDFRLIHKKELLKITGLMLPGVFAGMLLFRAYPLDGLVVFYGCVIAAVALMGLLMKKEFPIPEPVLVLLLVAAGVIHGMFVSGGALAVVYAVRKLRDKDVFRATLAPIWVLLSGIMLVMEVLGGDFTAETLALSAVCVPPLFLGVWAGTRIQKRVSAKTFMTLTYILLLISGVTLIL